MRAFLYITAIAITPTFVGLTINDLPKQPAAITTEQIIMPNQENPIDPNLVSWIKSNVSEKTGMPLSFYIPSAKKPAIYKEMGAANSVEAIIERTIVEEGLVIYDGAVGQMVLTMVGGEQNFEAAQRPLDIYWEGQFGELASIRAGFPINNFVYDPDNPELVSSDLKKEGERGFIFRIINANGHYRNVDPLDQKKELEGFPTWSRIHWEDWKPVAGENAWVVMAAMHLYHKKYFNTQTNQYDHPDDSVELKLAQEITRAAMILQAENGGVRMAPIGTYRNKRDFVDPNQKQGTWWYNQISSENNISWYGAFRMLYQVTGNEEYKEAMLGVEDFFKRVWNDEEKYFYQGMNYHHGQWHPNNDHFALDVQTWAIAAFTPEKIDQWFGEGTSFQMWETSKRYSGVMDEQNRIIGVGYTTENDRISVEWTAGAILAVQELAKYYQGTYSDYVDAVSKDELSMRKSMESLKTQISDNKSAYSYSSKRGWIPFGWYSHNPDVLSLASTGWMIFVDKKYNPFYISGNASENISIELSSLMP